VTWAELSITYVGSISKLDTSIELTVSLSDPVMLEYSVVGTDAGIESDTTNEVGCML